MDQAELHGDWSDIRAPSWTGRIADKLKREFYTLQRAELDRAFLATGHGGVYQRREWLAV